MFYSASSREQVDRFMKTLLTMLQPSGAVTDSLHVRAGETVYTYYVGKTKYEFTIAIYRHHDLWTGSLAAFNYDLP